jgi:hypothetical protein
VRFETVTRVGFVRVSTAAQVHADEAVRRTEVSCHGVERPVLGRDAVQADQGVRAFPSPAYGELYLAGDTFALPDAPFHGRGLYAKAFGEAGGGNLP